MTVNERIRDFRKKEKKMTQAEFATHIKMSRSNLSGIETGAVIITDRTIKMMCECFNVSEAWLRTGSGPMYRETESSIVDELCKRYNMSPARRRVMEIFLSMDDDKQEALAETFFNIVTAANDFMQKSANDDIDAEVEQYRLELQAERNAVSSPCVGGSEPITGTGRY